MLHPRKLISILLTAVVGWFFAAHCKFLGVRFREEFLIWIEMFSGGNLTKRIPG